MKFFPKKCKSKTVGVWTIEFVLQLLLSNARSFEWNCRWSILFHRKTYWQVRKKIYYLVDSYEKSSNVWSKDLFIERPKWTPVYTIASCIILANKEWVSVSRDLPIEVPPFNNIHQIITIHQWQPSSVSSANLRWSKKISSEESPSNSRILIIQKIASQCQRYDINHTTTTRP